eukprot:8028352-Pyramimonas_sp.AAC.1
MTFAIYELQKSAAIVNNGHLLLRAGHALEEWYHTCRQSRVHLLPRQYQTLLESAATHISLSTLANIHQLPKHH